MQPRVTARQTTAAQSANLMAQDSPKSLTRASNRFADCGNAMTERPHQRNQPKERSRRDAPHIHVVVREKNIERLEKEIRSRVAEGVANVLARLEAFAVDRSGLRLVIRHSLAATWRYLPSSVL